MLYKGHYQLIHDHGRQFSNLHDVRLCELVRRHEFIFTIDSNDFNFLLE